MEKWKWCVGYEGKYLVSNTGKVKSFVRKKGGELNIQVSPAGYCQVFIERTYKSVHRLMAFAFLGVEPGKNIVNHINGIKTDNRLENLEWVDAFGSMQHAVKMGLIDYEKAKETNRRRREEKKRMEQNIST